jgi:3-phenylpropionate/trans-cinnamate dioxygenase ferredoxin subunit
MVEVGPADGVGEGELRSLLPDAPVVITRLDGELYAFDENCSHRRCSLALGEIDGPNVVCPCHGAEFDVASGEVRMGPATEPIGTYLVEVRDGTAFVDF